jgi:hypothetical protein
VLGAGCEVTARILPHTGRWVWTLVTALDSVLFIYMQGDCSLHQSTCRRRSLRWHLLLFSLLLVISTRRCAVALSVHLASFTGLL